jgi:hypothetical protein
MALKSSLEAAFASILKTTEDALDAVNQEKQQLLDTLKERDLVIKELDATIETDAKRANQLIHVLAGVKKERFAFEQQFLAEKKAKNEALAALVPLRAKEQEYQLQLVYYTDAHREIAQLKEQIASLEGKENHSKIKG